MNIVRQMTVFLEKNMTQLMLFSSLGSSSYTAGGDSDPLVSRYELSNTYVVDNVQVKKDIRCNINGSTYALCGFGSIESVMAWNFLYQRMLDSESNYHEFTWDEMCQELGIELNKQFYDLVLKSILKVSIILEVKRVPFRFFRTFNSLCSRNFEDGSLSFALTLASSFCGLDPEFQQTIYRVLIENIDKSYSNPDDVEKVRNIARKQYRVRGQNRMMDIQGAVVATA